MVLNLQSRLTAALLSVTALFAVTALLTLLALRQLDDHSQRMVGEHWPTASAIMDTEIFFYEMRNSVFAPAPNADRDKHIANLQKMLQEKRNQLGRLSLDKGDFARIDRLLAAAGETLIGPVRLNGRPGEAMESADAAVQPVIDRARSIGRTDLVSMLLESVMCFNDYLITGNREEIDSFHQICSQIESHGSFGRVLPEYGAYKEKALSVFAVAGQLQQASSEFLRVAGELSLTLREIERNYQTQVITPATKLAKEEVQSATRRLILSMLAGLIASFVIGIIMSRRIAGVVSQVLVQVEAIRDGRIDTRLAMQRRDELGRLAAAVDSMAARISNVVVRICAASGNVRSVAGRLTVSAAEIAAGSQAQLLEVKATVAAVKSIQSSVKELGEGVEAVRDALCESRSSMQEMTTNIDGVAQNADQLAGASKEVHATMIELTASINEIAGNAARLKGSATENAAAISELDSTTRQIEEHSRQTAQITAEVRRLAESGQQTVNETIRSIGDIGQAMHVTTDMTHALAEDIRNIDKILAVIDEINDQTALLAFNATIIAAQAGEHGRSFAVVASEIRELSNRTSLSTKEIAQVLLNVQTGSTKVAETVDQVQRQVDHSEANSRNAEEALVRIVDGIREASRQVEKIARSTAEQTGGTHHLRDSIAGMAGMAEQIALEVEHQSREGEMISAASTRVQSITEQVRNAMREQSQASRVIAQMTESISVQFDRVEATSARQQRESETIIAAIGRIERSAEDGGVCSETLREMVEQLGVDVNEMEGEIAYFEVSSNAQVTGA